MSTTMACASSSEWFATALKVGTALHRCDPRRADPLCRPERLELLWTRRGSAGPRAGESPILILMPAPLIEFPADDPERARRFWRGVLGAELAPREDGEGEGWEQESDGLRLG